MSNQNGRNNWGGNRGLVRGGRGGGNAGRGGGAGRGQGGAGRGQGGAGRGQGGNASFNPPTGPAAMRQGGGGYQQGGRAGGQSGGYQQGRGGQDNAGGRGASASGGNAHNQRNSTMTPQWQQWVQDEGAVANFPDSICLQRETAERRIIRLKQLRAQDRAEHEERIRALEKEIVEREDAKWQVIIDKVRAKEQAKVEKATAEAVALAIAELTAKIEEMQRARVAVQEMRHAILVEKQTLQRDVHAEAHAAVDASNMHKAAVDSAIANNARSLAHLLENNTALAEELARLREEEEADVSEEEDTEMGDSDKEDPKKCPYRDVSLD